MPRTKHYAITLNFDYKGKLTKEELQAELNEALYTLEGLETKAINIEDSAIDIDSVTTVRAEDVK